MFDGISLDKNLHNAINKFTINVGICIKCLDFNFTKKKTPLFGYISGMTNWYKVNRMTCIVLLSSHSEDFASRPVYTNLNTGVTHYIFKIVY